MDYTYTSNSTIDDLKRAIAESGVYFSASDLENSMRDLPGGYYLLGQKIAYGRADTPEKRALINEQTNAWRSDNWGYTAGRSGDLYLTDTSSKTQAKDSLNSVVNYGDYSYPYKQYQDSLWSDIYNRKPFDWSKEEDPLWASYKKSYLREGERAQNNTMAQYAARTGGRPSSFAATAAGQAGDYYATKLNDKIPELYQMAYDKYVNEYNMKHKDLGMVNSMDQSEYGRWYDKYGMLTNNYNLLQGYDNTQYGRMWDNINYNNAQSQQAQQAQQQVLDNAYRMLQATGVVSTQAQADALGVPIGTTTVEFENLLRLSAGRGGGSVGTDYTGTLDENQLSNEQQVMLFRARDTYNKKNGVTSVTSAEHWAELLMYFSPKQLEAFGLAYTGNQPLPPFINTSSDGMVNTLSFGQTPTANQAAYNRNAMAEANKRANNPALVNSMYIDPISREQLIVIPGMKGAYTVEQFKVLIGNEKVVPKYDWVKNTVQYVAA